MDLVIPIYLIVHAVILGARGDVHCNFEFGKLCDGWSQGVDGAEDDFDWLIWNGHEPSQPAGDMQPGYTVDYTLPSAKEERAMFGTPVLEPTGGLVNVSFWFRLNGVDVRHLNVYVRDLSIGSPARKLWSADGSQGEAWHYVDLVFEVVGPFRILFEATIFGYDSDIGVDDIYVQNADPLPDGSNPWGEKIYPNLHAAIDIPTLAPPLYPVNAGTLGETTSDQQQKTWLAEYLPIILAVVGGSLFWIGIIVIIKCYVRKRRRRNKARRNVIDFYQTNRERPYCSQTEEEIYTLPIPPDIPAHETITISDENQVYDTRDIRYGKYGFSDYSTVTSDFR
ncbi:MAM and LDL-receptor class A domain-containing protein 1 [Patella vulgata]|uniref:MAM and LDL-receptor class A domain-containing protein 1 n=1 Tax=Patella vulgata TaxID=6465 RepID=UPI0021807A94|nr:MAM and LDL-receptor class A domain-containing protein 1 [Patella vulgata]